MSAPTKEERERAAGVYLRLQSDPRPYAGNYGLFLDAFRCVDVALRVADSVSDAFGLPYFDRTLVQARTDETAVEWIDRVALALKRWRGNFPSEHFEERGQHRREPRRVRP